MYLFYLDESGDPASWDSNDNFILAGVAIHEGQVRRLSEKLNSIQKKYFPSIQIPIEMHAHHIHSGKGRFRSVPKEKRIEILKSAYDVIARSGFPNLIAFVSGIHVSSVRNPPQALKDCLEDICTSFNRFLIRQYKAGYTDKGLLIIDCSGRDKRIRELMTEFECQGTRHGYLGNIMDVPYFADSGHTRMLQLADLLAFAAGRYFNSRDDTYLNIILNRIDRPSPKGKLIGLRHIIADNIHCKCIATH